MVSSHLALVRRLSNWPASTRKNLAGDTACARPAQEEHSRRQHRRARARLPSRVSASAAWRICCRQCFRERCAHPARLDHVHQNSKAAGLARHALGQAQQSRFAGGVGRGAKLAARSVDGPDQARRAHPVPGASAEWRAASSRKAPRRLTAWIMSQSSTASFQTTASREIPAA